MPEPRGFILPCNEVIAQLEHPANSIFCPKSLHCDFRDVRRVVEIDHADTTEHIRSIIAASIIQIMAAIDKLTVFCKQTCGLVGLEEVQLEPFTFYDMVQKAMTRGTNEAELGIRQTVGKNVKAAREYAGFSQRELGEKAGIGQAYLSQCESGKWNIGVDNIARIARATRFRPQDLLDPNFDPASFTRVKLRRSANHRPGED